MPTDLTLFRTQVRDVALGMSVRLAGERDEEYGLGNRKRGPGRGDASRLYYYGFADEVIREKRAPPMARVAADSPGGGAPEVRKIGGASVSRTASPLPCGRAPTRGYPSGGHCWSSPSRSMRSTTSTGRPKRRAIRCRLVATEAPSSWAATRAANTAICRSTDGLSSITSSSSASHPPTETAGREP